MKNKISNKKSFFSKLIVKIIRIFGYEIIDQSNLTLPLTNLNAIDNLSNNAVNMEASKSRIMDANYAKESTELARTQIIQQAGTAMLAQANQKSQSVLNLLKG